MLLTYRFRVKDKNHLKALRHQQWRANLIWNYCVEYQRSCVNFWPSHFDLVKATKELYKEHGLHSDVCSQICKQFVQSRNQSKQCPRFRSMRKSLGWVPFVRRAVQLKGDSVTFQKRRYRFWRHRDFNESFKTGCFTEDAQGHWFVCFVTEANDERQAPDEAVGIDLGLKDIATLSNGTSVSNNRWYRALEDKLAIAQRSGNKKRARAIHAKIKNRRKHHLHVASNRIARKYRTIVIGNVNSSSLAQTNMAKSVHDAGWYMFKQQLAYKARRHQGTVTTVNEAYTTQACSQCGSLSGPKGLKGLAVRDWECECGASHDRDVNAAVNILSLGTEHCPLVEESRRL